MHGVILVRRIFSAHYSRGNRNAQYEVSFGNGDLLWDVAMLQTNKCWVDENVELEKNSCGRPHRAHCPAETRSPLHKTTTLQLLPRLPKYIDIVVGGRANHLEKCNSRYACWVTNNAILDIYIGNKCHVRSEYPLTFINMNEIAQKEKK